LYLVCGRKIGRVGATDRPRPWSIKKTAKKSLGRRALPLTTRKESPNSCLGSAPKPVAKRIKAHIRWLEKELSRTEGDLEAAIESSPVLGENEALLRSVPGVGPVLARTLLAGVPELGTLTHKRVAALVGWACSLKLKRT
jgi:transposase